MEKKTKQIQISINAQYAQDLQNFRKFVVSRENNFHGNFQKYLIKALNFFMQNQKKKNEEEDLILINLVKFLRSINDNPEQEIPRFIVLESLRKIIFRDNYDSSLVEKSYKKYLKRLHSRRKKVDKYYFG